MKISLATLQSATPEEAQIRVHDQNVAGENGSLLIVASEARRTCDLLTSNFHKTKQVRETIIISIQYSEFH